MKPLKIQTVDSGNIAQALQISEERFNELLAILEEEMAGDSTTRVTDVAQRVVERARPNQNELFYIGLMFGEIVERHSQAMGGFLSPEQLMSALFRSAANEN